MLSLSRNGIILVLALNIMLLVIGLHFSSSIILMVIPTTRPFTWAGFDARAPDRLSSIESFLPASVEAVAKCEYGPAFREIVAFDPHRAAVIDPCRAIVELVPENVPLCAYYDTTLCNGHRVMASRSLQWRPHIARKRMDARAQPGGAFPQLCCDDTAPVKLYLRGRQFQSWWSSFLKLFVSGAAKCPVPCVVNTFFTGEGSGALDGSHVVIDVHEPQGDLPPGALQAVFALEPVPSLRNVYYPGPLNDTDILMTWSRDSDVHINYRGREQRPVPPDPLLEDLKINRYGFASAFVSNGDPRGRTTFFKELIKEVDRLAGVPPPPSPTNLVPRRGIDSYGRQFHTRGLDAATAFGGLPQKAHGGGKYGEKIGVMSQYKFHLAFENDVLKDYVTEKIFTAFDSGTVPVYFGTPDVVDFSPGGPDSYINALDFESPTALAEFLLELDKDHERYLKYLRWHKEGVQATYKAMEYYRFPNGEANNFLCRACQLVRSNYCPNPTLDTAVREAYGWDE